MDVGVGGIVGRILPARAETHPQHAAIVGHAFGQQQGTHAMQGMQPRHLARRAGGVVGDGGGIVEMRHGRTPGLTVWF